MFVPKFFQVKDLAEIERFIKENGFGILVSMKDGKPVATHVPFQLSKRDGKWVLTTHIALANPQWKAIEQSTEPVLVIFQGPHAYVSASWYSHENVSTWNYQAVHVYGEAMLLKGDELEKDVSRLLEKYEQHRENPVLWESLSEKTKAQLKGIVGIQIEVTEVEAAYKLSQNRNEADYASIVEHLEEESDVASIEMANVMRKNREV